MCVQGCVCFVTGEDNPADLEKKTAVVDVRHLCISVCVCVCVFVCVCVCE